MKMMKNSLTHWMNRIKHKRNRCRFRRKIRTTGRSRRIILTSMRLNTNSRTEMQLSGGNMQSSVLLRISESKEDSKSYLLF